MDWVWDWSGRGLDLTRDLFTEVETPCRRSKKKPQPSPSPPRLGCDLRLRPAKSSVGRERGGKKPNPQKTPKIERKRGHVMALPVWGGFPLFQVLEVGDQKPGRIRPFSPPLLSSSSRGREGGRLSQKDTASIPLDFQSFESLRKEARAKMRRGYCSRPQISQNSAF